jgi:uncharacterized protein (DUF342 family)
VFRAYVTRADGYAEVVVAPDASEASFATVAPPIGAGRPIRADTLLEELIRSGVVYGVDHDALEIIARTVSEGNIVQRAIVARGQRARPPRSAHIRPSFDTEAVGEMAVALPGEPIGTWVPEQPGEPGCDVRGVEMPVPKLPLVTPSVGDNLERLADDTIVAARLGRVSFDANGLRLKPLVSLSPEGQAATIDLYPRSLTGLEIARADYVAGLTEAGIQHGIDLNALGSACAEVRRTSQPVLGVIVARGEHPVDGDDGYLVLHFDPAGVGTVLQDGRIDFRERNFVKVARVGQVVAERRPATAGVAGRTVLGVAVQPKIAKGKEVSVSPTATVRRDPDGMRFFAAVEGMLMFKGGALEVHKLLELPGDVDLQTGHIDFPSGAVHVKGEVRSGFRVRAKGDVVVEGNVGAAVIETDGSVVIKGGITGKKKGAIRAGGSVTVRFADGADITARGEINILKNAFDTVLRSSSKVNIGNGTGRIVGGRIEAANHILVGDVGGEATVATHLAVGVDAEMEKRFPQLLARVAAAREEVKALTARLEGLRTAAVQGRQVDLAPVVRQLEQSSSKLQALDSERAAVEAARNSLRGASIRVMGTAYPGSTIRVHTGSRTLQQIFKRCTFSRHPEDEDQVISSIA